ncbi:hypothetical protein BDP27DRAFT_1212528 [Rhodocollybia butyracea]|uniref:Uncharacterized protein n=1 Tax=Rhodocollybia butyracea TaxID=206335 RepID=A0A9P5UES7_9AGAR|nr:hypothetical protein BDP27DRAFT_1212528 [Rhodocollybia butyracea]
MVAVGEDTAQLSIALRPAGGQYRFLGHHSETLVTAPSKPLEIRQPVLSREIFEVKYDIPTAQIITLPPMAVTSQTVTNSSDATIKKSLTYSFKKFESGTWNRTEGIELGVKTSFTVGVPGIASASGEISVGTSIQTSIGGTKGTEKTISDTTEVEVKPGQKVRAVATISLAQIDVPFTYKEKIQYSDGKPTEILSRNGVYRNVDSYNVVATIENL